MNYIELKNVNLKFKDQVIFNDASICIQKPGLYCLVGRNGCGKTTLFNVLTKRVKIDSGKLYSNTEKISYVDAKSFLFTNLTVKENLNVVSNDETRIDFLTNKFNLNIILDTRVKQLSEGERQRVAIIRALLEDKEIILLDEVTSHIDDETSILILNYLKELSKTHIIIYATHDEKDVDEFADSIIHIEEEKIIIKEINSINNQVIESQKNDYNPINLLNKIIRFIPTICLRLYLQYFYPLR